MQSVTYQDRRSELRTYFDHTASEAWSRLTSDAPVSGIRATVRAGRDRMRATLLEWLPRDLTGKRLLDAGCGTGALSVEAARRGADVIAIDIAESLVAVARERAAIDLDQGTPGSGRIDFLVGDMLDPAHGTFDHVVAMDSLIHYRMDDVLRMLATLSTRTTGSMVVTFAPRTPLLMTMHAVGRLFPRSDRAPAIEPLAPAGLCRAIGGDARLADWTVGRTLRVKSGFYTSQGLELVRQEAT
ncbi:MAG: magnesium protoporphyrin IX methyltransferase [Alphaproteobacteria bacterium]